MFKPNMKNADLIAMLSQATEVRIMMSCWSSDAEHKFEQIQVREAEQEELKTIMESRDYCPLQVQGGTENKYGKVNILCVAFQCWWGR